MGWNMFSQFPTNHEHNANDLVAELEVRGVDALLLLVVVGRPRRYT